MPIEYSDEVDLECKQCKIKTQVLFPCMDVALCAACYNNFINWALDEEDYYEEICCEEGDA